MRIIRSILLSLCLLAALVLVHGEAFAGLWGNPGKQKIKKLIHSSAAASANVGIKVVALPSGKTVFEENRDKLFIPASNEKIITAYGVLKALSPSYTFPAECSTDAWMDPGTVHNLYIKGYGDPSITLADLNLQAVTISEKIRTVTGDIVVDTSYFDDLKFGRGWMWDEGIVSWNAPISPYAVNGNCVDIFVSTGPYVGSPVSVRTAPYTEYAVIISSAVTAEHGDIHIRREETENGDFFIVAGSMSARSPERRWRCTVSRPGLYAGTLFKGLLERYGVTVNGNVYEAQAGTGSVIVERFASRNLLEILRDFLKDSNNLSGECLLKAVGAVKCSAPGDAAKGIAALEEALDGIGIRKGTYRLADGSGLSTYNQVSPEIMVKVLQAVYKDFSCVPEFMGSLSVAGRDGTLQNRFNQSPLAGNVRAKTGNMSGVSCISGYVQTRKGTILAVSIMMNGCAESVKPLQNVQDEILQTLYEYY